MARTQTTLSLLFAFAAVCTRAAHVAPAWAASDGQKAGAASSAGASAAKPGPVETPAESHAWPPATALELGARYTAGLPLGEVAPQLPLRSVAATAHGIGAEAGYRMLGALTLSGRCGLGFFLPDQWFGSDYSDVEWWGEIANAGLWATYSDSTQTVYRDWVSIGVGAEWLTSDVSVETSKGTGYKAEVNASAFPVLSAEFGYSLWGGRFWAFGVYLGADAGRYSSGSLRCDGDDCPDRLNVGTLQGSAWHGWVTFGARIVAVVPTSSLSAAR
jgi:hypothetical protein